MICQKQVNISCSTISCPNYMKSIYLLVFDLSLWHDAEYVSYKLINILQLLLINASCLHANYCRFILVIISVMYHLWTFIFLFLTRITYILANLKNCRSNFQTYNFISLKFVKRSILSLACRKPPEILKLGSTQMSMYNIQYFKMILYILANTVL